MMEGFASLPDLPSLNHALVPRSQLLPRDSEEAVMRNPAAHGRRAVGDAVHPITEHILQKGPRRSTLSRNVIGNLCITGIDFP